MREQHQDWTQLWTDDEDVGPKFWALRESFPAGFEPREHPVAVVIEWAYGGPDLPDADVLPTLHAFEALLDPLDAAGGDSVLVHVIRGEGVSELGYYTRDFEGFMATLNTALAGHPPFPIAIEYYDDPKWEYRKSIVDNFAQ